MLQLVIFGQMELLPKLKRIRNFMDRVRLGYVVDYFDFRIWPVFNIADSFITLGIGLFLISIIRRE